MCKNAGSEKLGLNNELEELKLNFSSRFDSIPGGLHVKE
jgi:hypothetical protein